MGLFILTFTVRMWKKTKCQWYLITVNLITHWCAQCTVCVSATDASGYLCSSQYGKFLDICGVIYVPKYVCSKSNFFQIAIGYTYGHPCMYAVYRTVQLKSKLKQTASWFAAALSSRGLCYRPAVFFHLATLSFIQKQKLGSFQKHNFIFCGFYFF